MKRLKIVLEYRYLYKIIVLLLLMYALIVNNFILFNSKYNKNLEYFEVIVDNISINDNKLSLDVIGYEKLKVIYYFKNYDDIKNIKLGDKLSIIGKLEIPSTNSMPNTFNYKKYLYYNHIFYILKANKIEKIENNTSLVYDVRNNINSIISKRKCYSYLKTFILGDKSNMDDIMNTYYSLGISHLFSISGMHISLLSGLLLFFLNRISYNRYYNLGIVIICLISYAIVIDFPVSVIRSIVMYILFGLRSLFNLKIKSIDVMFLVLSICIIIDTFIIYSIGFIISYLISFSLILFSDKIKNKKKKIIKALYVSYICFTVSFPICIYSFYEVNLITIFINVIVVPLVSIIIFPLSLLTFIFPFLDNLLFLFISILEYISLLVDNIDIAKIIFAKPNIFIVIFYYIYIYFALLDRRYLVIFILVVIIYKNILYFNNTISVTYLNVGQGDSSFIMLDHNKANILIDTGGIYNSNYSLVKNNTIKYLKSVGIDRINYLVISHGDLDHCGEAINLVENFKVEKVIFNCGEYNDLEKELIKVLDKKKIKYYSCIKELNIYNYKLYFLNTEEYDNENDNSNVIYTELNGYKFMFMGDAGKEKEKDILNKYNISDVDVLKVGHHGSRTSSSKVFIDEVNPKCSVISVGKNNRYGHPNKEVLNNLENSKIYRTDKDGSIMFKINDKLKIGTCSP